MATMTDIAKEAGVSIATVSLAINRGTGVSPAKKKAVEEAVEKLAYEHRPNRRKKRMGNIVFLSKSPRPPQGYYQVPAFPVLLGGIQKAVDEHGLNLSLAHSADGEKVPSVLTLSEVDGVIIFGPGALANPLQNALNKIPCIWCFHDHMDQGRQFDQVFYDNSYVGTMAANYLIDSGHRHLAFINLRRHEPMPFFRGEQFTATAREHGAKIEILQPAEDPPSGKSFQAIRGLVEQFTSLNPIPTGVFCPVDDIMLPFFNELRMHGIEPERDVKLIGCNNDPQFMQQMHPRPATVDIGLHEVGERAVGQLLWRIEHLNEKRRSRTLIHPVLVPGEREELENSGPENVNESIESDFNPTNTTQTVHKEVMPIER